MDWRREASVSRRHDLAGLGLVVPPTVFALGVLTFGCAWSRRCCELKGLRWRVPAGTVGAAVPHRVGFRGPVGNRRPRAATQVAG